MHPAEVPARTANRDLVEVAVARWDLEAPTIEADGAVALALRAPVVGTKHLAQRFTRQTRPADVLAVEEAPQGRRAELGVPLVVVLALHPRLCDRIEPPEREVGDVLEHRDQAPFEL